MKTYLLAPLVLILILAVVACGGGDPESHTFELEIHQRALAEGESVLRVKQNDHVKITVLADEPVNFHLHGYDIEQEARPGQPTTLDFVANATGSFPFTIHLLEDHDEGGDHEASADSNEGESHHEEGGHEESEVELGRLEVHPR